MIEDLRALTLWQPWAFFVAAGVKKIETRPRPMGLKVGQTIAIHASKTRVPGGRAEERRLWKAAGQPFDPGMLRRGEFVAVARVAGLSESTGGGYQRTRQGRVHGPARARKELHVGDFSAGRHLIHLRTVRVLYGHVPARGSLGLWRVSDEQQAAILEALYRRKPVQHDIECDLDLDCLCALRRGRAPA